MVLPSSIVPPPSDIVQIQRLGPPGSNVPIEGFEHRLPGFSGSEPFHSGHIPFSSVEAKDWYYIRLFGGTGSKFDLILFAAKAFNTGELGLLTVTVRSKGSIITSILELKRTLEEGNLKLWDEIKASYDAKERRSITFSIPFINNSPLVILAYAVLAIAGATAFTLLGSGVVLVWKLGKLSPDKLIQQGVPALKEIIHSVFPIELVAEGVKEISEGLREVGTGVGQGFKIGLPILAVALGVVLALYLLMRVKK